MTRARTDANQVEIMTAYRQLGCTVIDLSQVGDGCPDLLIGCAGHDVLAEVKNPDTRGVLTWDQKRFFAAWRGRPIQIVKTADDVLAHVAEVRRCRRRSGTA